MAANTQQHSSVPPPQASSSIGDKDVLLGRVVVPTPLNNKPSKKDLLGFDYAEHGYIGDAIDLTLANGEKIAAIDHKFTLDSGLSVTYGQINGLAGDFYGTTKPISDGNNAQEQSVRFVAAYNTLANASSSQPKEAQDILAVLQTEIDAVNYALYHHEDPSVAYHRLPDVRAKLEWLTEFRPSGFPSYLGLARINWDHFGADARITYNVGHAMALQTATNGDLDKAYTLNAFADHFLEDLFSSGHLRTPRRGLHGTIDLPGDGCAKLMHDEDCAIGLSVKNPGGQSWTCYGDKRALDEVAIDNLERCVAAVQASADEIYTAYTTKTVPPSSSYKAWTIAPTLESALSKQELAPLFRYKETTQDVERREVIMNRRMHKFTVNWWFWSTWMDCKTSSWWNYPLTMNGPLRIVPRTSFSVTTLRIRNIRLFFQNPLGGVLESGYIDGQWASGVGNPSLWNAALFTPLAAINWDNGNQIRVYYLSIDYKLHEYCYSNGRWSPGALDNMNIQAARDTSIAAFEYKGYYGSHIRVYCQEEGSNSIKEFCHDRSWYRGAILPSAVRGTSIAALAYEHNGLQFRVYYQAENLSIREHIFSDNRWTSGPFVGDKAPGRTQIGALFGSWRGVVLDVYWMNTNFEITRSINILGSWHTSKVIGPLTRDSKFAATQWQGGQYIRLYYQSPKTSVLEICNNEDGEWFPGNFVGEV